MNALVIGGTGPTGPNVVQGLLDRGVAEAAGITMSDVIPARLDQLRDSYGACGIGP